MKILIFGSTYITELVVKHLLERGYDLIGHVPSRRPVFPGVIPLPVVDENSAADLVLSIQYDAKIRRDGYNLHTGILPAYGGCNILHHTLRNGDQEQGLTFHELAPEFDGGAVVSKITYPVHPGDREVDLYKRMAAIAPAFTEACLKLLPVEGHGQVPRIYKRDAIDPDESARAVESITKFIDESR